MVPASRMLRAACRQEEDLTSYKPCRRHLRKLKWLLATDFMLTAHIAGVLPPHTGHQLTPCPDVSPRSTAVCGPEGEPEHKQTKVPRHSPTAGVSWGTEKGWNTALIRGKPFCLHNSLHCQLEFSTNLPAERGTPSQPPGRGEKRGSHAQASFWYMVGNTKPGKQDCGRSYNAAEQSCRGHSGAQLLRADIRHHCERWGHRAASRPGV